MRRLLKLIGDIAPGMNSVSYISSVVGILAGLIAIYVFFWSGSDSTPPQDATAALSGTGALGLQFSQNNKILKLTTLDGKDLWHSTNSLVAKRAPVQVLVPKTECDQADDSLAVRVFDDHSLEDVSRMITQAPYGNDGYSTIFNGGLAVAAERHFVKTLYFEHVSAGDPDPFHTPWNYFFSDRISGQVGDKWVLSIENIGDPVNVLKTAKEVVLVLGRPPCGPQSSANIDVVGVTFSD